MSDNYINIPISYNGASLLQAAARVGISMPYSCKSGRCSACKCKIIKGETTLLFPEVGLSEEDKSSGWVLGCARTASTDLVLDVVGDMSGIVLPPAVTQPCRISSLEKLAPDVIKVVLRLPPNVTFNFIPGQYIDVIGPDGSRRSYSIANSPKLDKTLDLHIRAVQGGVMSHYWFNQAKINDLLRLHGPHGTFFMRSIAKRDLIFLATGTGIAPVKAMLEHLANLDEFQQPNSVTLVWGGRYQHDLYFDVGKLMPGVKYIPVLSRAGVDWVGVRGYVQDVLTQIDLSNSIVFGCGSTSMIQGVRDVLTAKEFSSKNFYADAFVESGTVN